MPVNIYCDASLKGSEARGAYVVTANNQTHGFKSKTNYSSIKLFRTPIMEVGKKSKITNIDDMELRTLVQGLLHAFRIHTDQEYFTIYSDNMNAINKLRTPWYEMSNGLDPLIEIIHSYIKKDERSIKIKAIHVKAHKSNLSSTPEKFNFVCDMMASVVNKI